MHFQSTKVCCTFKVQEILSKYQILRSKQQSILSNYKSTLSKYKSILSKYKVTFGTSGSESPEPGTFLTPPVLGPRVPEPVLSKPREWNLTRRTHRTPKPSKPRARNLLNPEPWQSLGSGTRFPGTGSQNPFPSQNHPYIAQRPHSILLLGKNTTTKQEVRQSHVVRKYDFNYK